MQAAWSAGRDGTERNPLPAGASLLPGAPGNRGVSRIHGQSLGAPGDRLIDEPGRDPATNAEHEQQPASDPDRQSIGTTTTGSAAGYAAAAATRGDRARARTARSRSHPAARARPRVPAYRSGADAEATRGGRAAPLRRFLAVTCSLPARTGPEGPASCSLQAQAVGSRRFPA